MTHLSWVAQHGMVHSFIELRKPLHHDKAVIREGERLKAKEKGAAPDIHERDAAYLERAHAAYVLLAERYGWVRIASSADGVPLPIEAIHEKLYGEAVRRL